MRQAVRPWLLLGSLVFVVDRLSKAWALALCSTPRFLAPGLTCQLTFNQGISWGLFKAENLFAWIALTSVLAIIIILLSYHAYKRWQQNNSILGETLVIAGALSNMFDRVFYGAVIDFILLGYDGLYFPTLFNVADVAITIGVLCMLKSTYTHA